MRTEDLVLTEDIVLQAYKSGSTVLTPPEMPPYLKPSDPSTRVNVALTAHGATASASSTYDGETPARAVINGDRTGTAPPGRGYWADDTPGIYPDWVEVAFAGPKTINEIDVFSPQDAPLDGTGRAVDPTEDLTFVKYGLTDFDVQYWNGVAWVTVASVSGNNKVWRQFRFSDVTTDKIRVLVHNSPSSYSHVAEIEAHESGTGRNVALALNGGQAAASSNLRILPPQYAINGDRVHYGWYGQEPFAFPGWLQIDFHGMQTINEIDIFSYQDITGPPVAPTEELTFSQYGLIDFDVQSWDGSQWVTAPSGNVTGNNRVWRKVTFPPVTTDKVRVLIHKTADGKARLQEVEAYSADLGWGTEDYPVAFQGSLPTPQAADATRPGLALTPVGYGFAVGDTPYAHGYFAATARRRYDFHDNPGGKGRGLPKVARDPLRHDTSIAYDVYALLPTTVTDPAGLTTSASYDYRVLQPREVIDPNGNRTTYTFTPLGLLESAAVMGKAGENIGDTLDAPGVTMVYDFLTFTDHAQPISVRTIKRVHHVNETDVPQPQRDEIIESLEYSDGFGRLLQTRVQAEDDIFANVGLHANQSRPVEDAVGQQHATNDPPHVVVSGWQIYDNKGRVVEKYEPRFSSGWDYAPTDAQDGAKVTMYYDPRGQVIRTVNPDGSEQRVLYGVPGSIAAPNLTTPEVYEPTPWEAYTYDANDNAGRTHLTTSTSYQNHWNTPASAVVDALGRTVSSVQRNGPNPGTDWYTTRSTYDIRGNLLTVTDALGRVAFTHMYDLATRPLRIESIDAGLRRTMVDAAGNTIEQRDSKGALILHAYDALNRLIRSWARDGTGQTLTLREQLVYGDSVDLARARAANLLGKLHEHYDEAGRLTIAVYDFKGNVLEKTRQAIRDDLILSVFVPAAGNNWVVQPFRVNWQPPAGTTMEDLANNLLESTAHQTSLTYDALNRVKSMRYPAGVEGVRKVLYPMYNRAGGLESVRSDDTTYVERIAYNAKGQRTLIAYGNGVMTRHAYDQNFRLVRMRTERYETPVGASLTYHPTAPNDPLQDFAYGHDLVGNITAVHDRTPQSGLLARPDRLDRAFTYDPLYRLLSATGRECDVPPPSPPWSDLPRCDDLTRTRGYTEQYSYDPVGNMIRLQHTADTGSFTRAFSLSPQCNRLATLTIGRTIYEYSYDANGNLTQETTSRHCEWDHSDRLRVYSTQVKGAEPSVHAHYLYDASGQRVKKLVRKQGGQYEVIVYVDGIFEYQRTIQGSATAENNMLHIMDNQNRIALVRVGDPFPDDKTPAIKYHLGDHLGSSNVVIDDTGTWINHEEYTPYGETSFGSFALKRYRFTGKEHDEESGFYYHGARYYMPWLGRWTICDPAGLVDGPNPYGYVCARPTTLVDPKGRQGQPTIVKINDVVPYDQPLEDHASIGVNPQKDHVIAQSKQHLMNPDIDTSKQLTVVQETGAAKGNAPAKPHTQVTFHDPQADTKEIERLRALKPADWTSFEAEIVSPSLESRYRAGYAQSSTNIAALDEIGSMFELHQPNRAPNSSFPKLDWSKRTEPVGPPVDPKTGRVIKAGSPLAARPEVGVSPKVVSSRLGPGIVELDPRPSGADYGIMAAEVLHDVAEAAHATREYESWKTTLAKGPVRTLVRLAYEAVEGARMIPGFLWSGAKAVKNIW